MGDEDDGVLRIWGGPYDGAEIDVEYIFAGRTPDRLGIGRSGPNWLIASYELDIDADGPYYRFTGSVGHRTAQPPGTPMTFR